MTLCLDTVSSKTPSVHRGDPNFFPNEISKLHMPKFKFIYGACLMYTAQVLGPCASMSTRAGISPRSSSCKCWYANVQHTYPSTLQCYTCHVGSHVQTDLDKVAKPFLALQHCCKKWMPPFLCTIPVFQFQSLPSQHKVFRCCLSIFANPARQQFSSHKRDSI